MGWSQVKHGWLHVSYVLVTGYSRESLPSEGCRILLPEVLEEVAVRALAGLAVLLALLILLLKLDEWLVGLWDQALALLDHVWRRDTIRALSAHLLLEIELIVNLVIEGVKESACSRRQAALISLPFMDLAGFHLT